MSSVRVRFAPSPTGHLHVGGARTAIFNWLFARHHGGAFVLRIEDTDVVRSTLESEAMVLSDLRWLGLDWDEGPDREGPYGPYRQSERIGTYRRVAGQLLERGIAYRCFCREDDLEAKRREAEASGRNPHYDLTCYRLTPDELEGKLARKEPCVIRFHVPKEPGAEREGDVAIHDLIRGEVQWKKEILGDFILLRQDGMPTYNFSVVVDDHAMEMTHVIRAEEHLPNTHRQVLLYRALDWELPAFAHVSLILGPDRSKLSKRHGAASVSTFAEEGFLPDALVNYLTLLGWSSPRGEEIFSRAHAIEEFSLERLNPAPAIFDPTKLEWMNGQYLQASDSAELLVPVLARMQEAGWVQDDGEGAREWLLDAIEIVKRRVHTLEQVPGSLEFVFEFDELAILSVPEHREAMAEEGARRVVVELRDDLRDHGSPDSADRLAAMMERLKAATAMKGKKLFGPIRLALTGTLHGPELQNAIPLIERGSRTEGIAPIVPALERVERFLKVLER